MAGRSAASDNETPFGQAETHRRADGRSSASARRSSSAIPSAAPTATAFALDLSREDARAWSSVAPATHPWPGGATSWYYSLTAMPVVGRLFAETLACPAGTLRMAAATACVFAPNTVPDDYADSAVDRAGAAARRLPRQCDRRRRASTTTRSRSRAALPRDRRADRRHLRRPRHGRLRGDPLDRAGARHPGRRAGLGAAISATSRTGSRRTWWSPRSRRWPASRATCRRWRGRSKQRIAGDAYGERHLHQGQRKSARRTAPQYGAADSEVAVLRARRLSEPT